MGCGHDAIGNCTTFQQKIHLGGSYLRSVAAQAVIVRRYVLARLKLRQLQLAAVILPRLVYPIPGNARATAKVDVVLGRSIGPHSSRKRTRRTPAGARRSSIQTSGWPRSMHNVKKALCFARVKATKNEFSSSMRSGVRLHHV